MRPSSSPIGILARESLIVLLALTGAAVAVAAVPDNPEINYAGYRQLVQNTQSLRAERRLDEADFLAAMREPGTVLLDARSADAFALRHLAGAVNLPFTDFTAERLARILPDTSTRVLIYCNNNFSGSPTAFPTKLPPASLNLSTWSSLRAYGYDNVYELGPYLDVANTLLPFEGSEVAAAAQAAR